MGLVVSLPFQLRGSGRRSRCSKWRGGSRPRSRWGREQKRRGLAWPRPFRGWERGSILADNATGAAGCGRQRTEQNFASGATIRPCYTPLIGVGDLRARVSLGVSQPSFRHEGGNKTTLRIYLYYITTFLRMYILRSLIVFWLTTTPSIGWWESLTYCWGSALRRRAGSWFDKQWLRSLCLITNVNSTGKYWFFPAFIVNVYRVKPTSEDLEFR
jgi:hypothetical protein